MYIHRERSDNVVRCDNVVVAARDGLSNIPCRRRLERRGGR
jgi:hypothetical protein